MLKAKFAYNEPMFGTIEIEGDTEGMNNEEFTKQIEISYPEAIDIEILEVVEI